MGFYLKYPIETRFKITVEYTTHCTSAMLHGSPLSNLDTSDRFSFRSQSSPDGKEIVPNTRRRE